MAALQLFMILISLSGCCKFVIKNENLKIRINNLNINFIEGLS